MPSMPPGPEIREGILKGMYRYRASENRKSKLRAQIFGSGAILREALKAQELLEEKYGVAADVWSVTSYKALYNDGINTERWNLLGPASSGGAWNRWLRTERWPGGAAQLLRGGFALHHAGHAP